MNVLAVTIFDFFCWHDDHRGCQLENKKYGVYINRKQFKRSMYNSVYGWVVDRRSTRPIYNNNVDVTKLMDLLDLNLGFG